VRFVGSAAVAAFCVLEIKNLMPLVDHSMRHFPSVTSNEFNKAKKNR
jgi:hypothetical protein